MLIMCLCHAKTPLYVTLYQLVDDNYQVKVPCACTDSRGGAYALGRCATELYLDLFAYCLQSPHKKAPAHHTRLPQLVDRGVIPARLAEAVLVVHDSAKTLLDLLRVLL